MLKPGIARGDPDYYPAVVAANVLGGGYSARLNQEIRIKRGLSYGASAGLSAVRTTGSFRASAQTKNESAGQVLDLIKGELERLATQPAGADELKARKSNIVGGYGRALATSEGLADTLGNFALYDIPLDELSRYTGKVEAVQAAQVQAAARRIFDPAQASVLVVGDAKTFSPELKPRLPALNVIPVDQLDLDSPTLKK